MIFVTVGTTMPFDKLITRIDELKGENLIKDDVVCQIGNGKYIPVNCEYFRFKPSIEEDIDNSSLIIAHGGTGTVFSLLAKDKPFIIVTNDAADGNHQVDFLERLSQDVLINYISDLSLLDQVLKNAFNSPFKESSMELPSLSSDLIKYIEEIC
jgi:UDP-N-acetylglucosamine transferase subunit ALG13